MHPESERERRALIDLFEKAAAEGTGFFLGGSAQDCNIILAALRQPAAEPDTAGREGHVLHAIADWFKEDVPEPVRRMLSARDLQRLADRVSASTSPAPRSPSLTDTAGREAGAAEDDGWRTMESAPRDATDVLVYVSRSAEYGTESGTREEFVTISSYEDQPFRRGYRHRNGARGAIRWRPLPDRPRFLRFSPEGSERTEGG